MNQYQGVEKEISELKKPLKWCVFGGVGLNFIVLLISCFVQFRGEKAKSYSNMEACFYGMKSIFNNNPNEEEVNNKVITDLSNSKTVFDVERIHLVKFIDGFHCDVVAKDPKGFRNFRVALEKSSKFKHDFKIVDVAERQIESRYQR